MSEKMWITIPALAHATGKNERTVRRWIKAGGITTATRVAPSGQHVLVVWMPDVQHRLKPLADVVTVPEDSA
jgi:hypothetical protein